MKKSDSKNKESKNPNVLSPIIGDSKKTDMNSDLAASESKQENNKSDEKNLDPYIKRADNLKKDKQKNQKLRDDGVEKLIDFQKMLAIIEKNFIVLLRDKTRIIPLLAMPIVMIMVFGFISGNIPKHIPTAIVSYDNSPLSQQIQQEISNSNVLAIKHVVSSEGEGKNLLDKGKVKVLITIPPNIERDINNGQQAHITVIVDESDSSIGETAKQTISQIISALSYKISLQKINYYQKSVGSATMTLQNQLAVGHSQYLVIAEQSKKANAQIIEAKKINDQLSYYLVSNLALPVPVVISSGSNSTDTINDSYLFDVKGTSGIKYQIGVLKAESYYLLAASRETAAVAKISSAAQDAIDKNQEYEVYDKNVVKPLSQINVFTYSKAEGIVRPLIYDNKPAYGTGKRKIDFLIPSIIALIIFQGAVMGMGRAIAGEKRDGSLTRVFLTPTSNATIILGTLAFYIIFELFRSCFIIIISMIFFNITIEGSLLLMLLILTLYAGISASIGLVLSSAVRTEQQFMAMAMLVSLPTMFLSGAFFPIQAMPKFMQIIAQFLPVTYGGDALRGVMVKGFSIGMITYPLAIMMLFLVSSIAVVFMVFKRDIE